MKNEDVPEELRRHLS